MTQIAELLLEEGRKERIEHGIHTLLRAFDHFRYRMKQLSGS